MAAVGTDGLLAEVLAMLATYLTQLRGRLNLPDTAGAAAAAAAAGEEPPLAAQRECVDRHPQCEYWAGKDECIANPTYMLGREGKGNGWCRAACKACTPPAPPNPKFSGAPLGQHAARANPLLVARAQQGPKPTPPPRRTRACTEAEAQFLGSLAADLQGKLLAEACTSGVACQALSRSGEAQLRERMGGEDSAALLAQADVVSDPVHAFGGSGGDDSAARVIADPDL